jgi:alcohol dehydrogenase class IV
MSKIYTPTGNKFTFDLPTKLVFGCGRIAELTNHLKDLGTLNPLIVTGSKVSRLQPFKEMTENLKEHGIDPKIWDGTISDPTEKTIQEGANQYREANCDGIVAYGGGSSMDTAKALGLLVQHNEDAIIKFIGKNALPITGTPPLVCIPTTAGTGSEVTNISVFTFTPMERKLFAINKALYPDVSIVDPELTYTMPPSVTASTGLDALSHAIGCYTHANGGNPISDALALYSIELVSKSLRKAVQDGKNLDARIDMSTAATLAGIAFGHGGVHLEHSIGHVLGVKNKVPHGFSCTMLMPEILEFISSVKLERIVRIGEMLGVNTSGMNLEEAGVEAISAVKDLMNDVGAPSLADYGIYKEDIPALTDKCKNEMWSSPKPIEASDFEQMFRKAIIR